MSYCSGFFSPTECHKRSLFLVSAISFVAIYLISCFHTSHHLTALPKRDNLHTESGQSSLKKLFTDFKQTPGKESGAAPPPAEEKRGGEAARAPAQPFAFLINEEEKCKDTAPFLVLLISTRAGELQHRQAIRHSWAGEAAAPGAPIVRLFLLGVEAGGAPAAALRGESEQYRDIIQQDFLDTYNNLTLKTLMGMRWVATYCSRARFAMKTDSDVFVNTEHLVERLLRPLPPLTRNYFTGHLMRGHRPIRNKASKWYISEEEFPGNWYHPFCSGTGYVFSGDLAAKIVNASLTVDYIHLEDVYIGFCLHAKGVEIVQSPYSLFNLHKVPFSPCAYNKIITSHHILPHEHIHYWKTLQEKKDSC